MLIKKTYFEFLFCSYLRISTPFITISATIIINIIIWRYILVAWFYEKSVMPYPRTVIINTNVFRVKFYRSSIFLHNKLTRLSFVDWWLLLLPWLFCPASCTISLGLQRLQIAWFSCNTKCGLLILKKSKNSNKDFTCDIIPIVMKHSQ